MVRCVQCGDDEADAWAEGVEDDRDGASTVSSGGASAFPLALLVLVLASVRRRRRPVVLAVVVSAIEVLLSLCNC